MSDKIIKFLNNGFKQGVYPGAVLLVSKGQDIVFLFNAGNRAKIPNPLPMEKDTIFDLASLTKPLATTLAIMKLVNDGMLDLDVPISSIIKPFLWKDKTDITVRLLLNHSSGIKDWRPFYLQLIKCPRQERKSVIRRLIMEEPLVNRPKKASLYSDLGFMLLEWIIEIISGRDLTSYLDDVFFRFPGLKNMYLDNTFEDNGHKKKLCASTENCPWRREVIQGHVHDENAYALGGYSGHAGLFGTAWDIFTLTNELINIYHGDSAGLLKKETVRTFFTRQNIVSGSTWALGWDTPSVKNSSSGNYFSPCSIGHLGFTGTSVWIDLERHITVIFLTNRIHPDRTVEKIRVFRPKIHDLVMSEFAYVQ
ncbi:MAG: serine hydrolase [Thermodesulfobacteriota bacterium]|nr:serine hydrolase [Thermodesulfobacteriota bacterium]